MGQQSPTAGQDNHCIICYQRNVSWLCLSISLNLKKKWTDLSFDEGVRPKNIVQPNSSGTQLLIKCFVSLPFQENMDNYLHVQI